MTRKYWLAALLLAVLGVPQSNAEDAPPVVTIDEYSKHLVDVFGANGTIIAGTVNGKDQNGNFIEDVFPSPDPARRFFSSPIKPLSFTVSEAACATSQIITRPTSGAYAYPWCAKFDTIGGTAYEAKRDTFYYAGGRWTYLISVRFDCQNASDLAQMPTSVSVAVCH